MLLLVCMQYYIFSKRDALWCCRKFPFFSCMWIRYPIVWCQIPQMFVSQISTELYITCQFSLKCSFPTIARIYLASQSITRSFYGEKSVNLFRTILEFPMSFLYHFFHRLPDWPILNRGVILFADDIPNILLIVSFTKQLNAIIFIIIIICDLLKNIWRMPLYNVT